MPLDGGIAIVRVIANGAALSGQIATATEGGVAKAQSRISAAGSKIAQTLTSPVFLAGAAVTALAAKAVMAASDLAEAQNKVNVVFEGSVGIVDEFAKHSAEAFGISETSALQAAGAFGQLLQAAGLTEAATAEMSIKLVQLAADLASFNNIDPTEALQKIQAGLAGQARPLREVGVFLSAARVEEEAYAAGIAKTGAELTDAQKIQARYNLILKDTAKAQGDFARTVGFSLPNQLRVLKAEVEDLAVGFGQALLPSVELLVKGLRDLLPIIVKLVPAIIAFGAAWLGFKAISFVPVLLTAITGGLETLALALNSTALISFVTWLEKLVPVASKAAIGTAATAYAIGSVSAAAQNTTTELRDLNAAAQTYFGGLQAGTLSQTELNSFITGNVAALHGNADAFRLAAEQGISYTDALWSSIPITDEANHHWRALQQTIAPDMTGALRELKSELKTAKASSKEFAQAAIGQFDLLASGLTNVEKTFALTAKALVRNTGIVAEKQRTLATDLKKLDDLKIGQQLKTQLISLGPDVVDAFIKAAPAQRTAVEKNLRAILDAQKKTNREVQKAAHDGFVAVGTAMGQGAIEGIIAESPQLTAAARRAVQQAIDAAKAQAGIKSPSKAFEKIGIQMMQGLVVGMQHEFRTVTESLRALIPLMRDALGTGASDQAQGFLKDLDALDKRFGKLKDKVGSFKSAIRGAFTDASDLIGGIGAALEQFRSDQADFLQRQAAGETGLTAPGAPNLGATVASQVAQTQLLAQLLKQLQAGGLSTANLGQLAGQGAGAIPIAQALLQDPQLIQQLNQAQQEIADITQTTVDKLTSAAFGDKVQRMGEQLDRLLGKLQDFLAGLDVPALKDETRDFINQLRRLNEALGAAIPGGGGGGGGGSNITINVNAGPGTDGQQVGRDVRDALLGLQRRNGSIGLGGGI